MMIFNLSADQFRLCRLKLEAAGLTLPTEPQGEIVAKGVTVKYAYSEPTLTVSVIDYGGNIHFFVDHTIRGWFDRSSS